KDDIDTFEKLKQKGVTFDVRKVPADSKDNMDNLISKAKAELK
ncbi:MAG: PTS mannose transporter subunit IIAB, partial [Ileibacterium sp.]|nr:PTS mannose transporter subunit IIAB [Ileibacterium sp.]